MSDIVERLRYWNPVTFPIVYEAADAIERLQSQLAEVERDRDHNHIQELRLATKLAKVERERDALREAAETAADDCDDIATDYDLLNRERAISHLRAISTDLRAILTDESLWTEDASDSLQARLAERELDWLNQQEQIADLQSQLNALREAAGKVTCAACNGKGSIVVQYVTGNQEIFPCPDCTDLRALLADDAGETK